MEVQPKVVVVGAGVAGLTTALLLAQRSYSVTIVAKYHPGDEAADYTSPWGGANYLPVSSPGSREAKWDKDTWPFLWRLANEEPEAGVQVQPATLWNRITDQHNDVTDWFKELVVARPWFADMVPDFRNIPVQELPEGYYSGTSFKTVCINVPVYLKYLLVKVQQEGVVIRKAELNHIAEAKQMHHSGQQADVVVCCPGIRAATLGGVEDDAVFPARGQLVIVANEISGLYTTSGTDDGPFETMYAQPRQGGGTVIGGSYQKHDWNDQIDEDLANRIMARAVRICPELTGGKGPEALAVVRHVVGLRPLRKGGPRLEEQTVDGVSVVYNYGHGGFGYQSSYGCSLEVIEIVDRIVNSSHNTPGATGGEVDGIKV